MKIFMTFSGTTLHGIKYETDYCMSLYKKKTDDVSVSLNILCSIYMGMFMNLGFLFPNLYAYLLCFEAIVRIDVFKNW